VNRADLEQRGFTGWIPLLSADASSTLPNFPGVYAVAYNLDRPKIWPNESRGGWHKGRNPAVDADRLDREWVDGTDIVYLGKTDRTLKQRICEFGQFGRGEAVAHWGGRLVWQLPELEALLIGWKVLDQDAATSEESVLLREFVDSFSRLPFANLRK
jgi:hypothetical protein